MKHGIVKRDRCGRVQSASATFLITFYVYFASMGALPLQGVTDILGKPTETARTMRDTQLYQSVGMRSGGHGGQVEHGERLGHGSVDALEA